MKAVKKCATLSFGTWRFGLGRIDCSVVIYEMMEDPKMILNGFFCFGEGLEKVVLAIVNRGTGLESEQR